MAATDLGQQPRCLLRVQWALVEQVGQGRPLDVLHAEVHASAILANLVDRDDARVIEPCSRLRFG